METSLLEARQAPLRSASLAGCLDALEASGPQGLRKCKIACTLGPGCKDESALGRLLDAGVDSVRLDFSYDLNKAHAQTLRSLRAAVAAREGKEVAVILDIKGLEVRTGRLKDGATVQLKAGEELMLVADASLRGDARRIGLEGAQWPSPVEPGDRILVADGSLSLQVLDCEPRCITTRVLNDYRLGERESCWMPGMDEEAVCDPAATFRDVVNFGIPQGVDYIAMGCVRGPEDIEHMREVLGERGSQIGILAKIGSEAGLENLDDIIRESDGIIVARGDLAMRLPLEKAFLAQKAVIAKCNRAGKPVLVTSQLPDLADAVNAVLDGADGLLLCDRAAPTRRFEAALSSVSKSCKAVEAAVDQSARHQTARSLSLQRRPGKGSPAAASLSAVEVARSLRAKLLLVLTTTGQIAHAVSRLRPSMPVLAVTSNRRTARKMQVMHGVSALVVEDLPECQQAALSQAAKAAEGHGWVSSGDTVVAVHGREEDTWLDEDSEDEESDVEEGIEAEGSDEDAEEDVQDHAERACCEVSTLALVHGKVHVAGPPATTTCEPGSPEALRPVTSARSRVLLEDDLEEILGASDSEEEDEEEEEESLPVLRRCKVMCIVGPRVSSVDDLVGLLDAGMDVCRLDFSHGDPDELVACAGRLHEAVLRRPERTVAVLADVERPDLLAGLRELREILDEQALEVDFVAFGPVGDASDVRRAREAWGLPSQGVRLLAKIETQASVRSFEDILQESDGIMVVQSKLAAELTSGKAILAQKIIIGKCNAAGKPVVAATPLASMLQAPRPSQAEASDLANAVLDGADCVALGLETAEGDFAEDATEVARSICEEATEAAGGDEDDEEEIEPASPGAQAPPVQKAIEEARKLEAGLLAVVCQGDEAIMEVAKRRLSLPVAAITWDLQLARRLNLVRGILPLYTELVPGARRAEEVAVLRAIEQVRNQELVSDTRHVVLSFGSAVRVFEPVGSEESCCYNGVSSLSLAVPLPKLNLGGRLAGLQLTGAGSPHMALRQSSGRIPRSISSPHAGAQLGLGVLGITGRVAGGVVQAGARAVHTTSLLPGLLGRAAVGVVKSVLKGDALFKSAAQPAANGQGELFLKEYALRAGVITLDSGLRYQVLRMGHGTRRLSCGGTCICHFEGRVASLTGASGPPFVSTYTSEEPKELQPDELMAGCTEALYLMTQGDKWEVCIPPHLGYGEQGSPPAIQGGDVILFTIEMLEIVGAPSPPTSRRPSVQCAEEKAPSRQESEDEPPMSRQPTKEEPEPEVIDEPAALDKPKAADDTTAAKKTHGFRRAVTDEPVGQAVKAAQKAQGRSSLSGRATPEHGATPRKVFPVLGTREAQRPSLGRYTQAPRMLLGRQRLELKMQESRMGEKLKAPIEDAFAKADHRCRQVDAKLPENSISGRTPTATKSTTVSQDRPAGAPLGCASGPMPRQQTAPAEMEARRVRKDLRPAALVRPAAVLQRPRAVQVAFAPAPRSLQSKAVCSSPQATATCPRTFRAQCYTPPCGPLVANR